MKKDHTHANFTQTLACTWCIAKDMFAIYYKAFFRLITRVRVCRLPNTPHSEYAIQACLVAGADRFDLLLAKRLVKGLHRLVYEERLRRWVYRP